MSRRAIVIGGGANGLVAALYLARAGISVNLLERRPVLGGLSGSWQFGEDHRLPGLLHDYTLFCPTVEKTLGLVEGGLQRQKPPAVIVPGQTGAPLALEGEGIDGDLTSRDWEAHAKWRAFLERVRPFLRRQLTQAPPPVEPTPGNLWELGSAAISLRSLGRKDMLELVRVLPMPVGDWLQERFQNERLCAALSFPALFGSFVGPRAAGTATNLLVHHTLSGQAISGGPAALIEALTRLAQAAGVQIRTGVEVEEILVREGRAAGVQGGSQVFETDLVVATCDPAQALTRLIDPFLLSVRQVDALDSLRSRGVVAKIHLAIEGSFALDCSPESRVQRAYLGCESIDQLEKSLDAPKYGEFSSHPALDVRVASDQIAGPSSETSVISILAYGAPFTLKGGWTDTARDQFLEAVLSQLESYSSGIRSQILELELLTPDDLASEFLLPGGHLCHLEQALDQFASLRPVAFASRYQTPIEGLFLAGSGCHPGGGLTGLPGWLGARAAQG